MAFDNPSSFVTIGQFGSPFGVLGWIKVNSFTDPATNVLAYQPWFVGKKDKWQSIQFVDSKSQQNKIIVKIAGRENIEAVQQYTNQYIAIPRKQLPKPAKNEFYWTDLIGMKVVNKEHVDLGVIDSLLATGANDVLVVHDDKRERLIPFIESAIVTISEKERMIVVDWDADF